MAVDEVKIYETVIGRWFFSEIWSAASLFLVGT